LFQPALDGIRFGWCCLCLGCSCHLCSSVTGIARAEMELTDGLIWFVEGKAGVAPYQS
jgi:hypothetical protein